MAREHDHSADDLRFDSRSSSSFEVKVNSFDMTNSLQGSSITDWKRIVKTNFRK